MIRLFHCDDSDAMRLLIREQFASSERVEVVGDAADPEGAVSGTAAIQPDVVLLDLLDPENADRLVRELRAALAERLRAQRDHLLGAPATQIRPRSQNAL